MELVFQNSVTKSFDLSGAPGQSGPSSDGNEGVIHIPQSFSIIGT